MSIYVTKPYLPSFEEYEKFLKDIWETNVLTNQGKLLKKFESELSAYLRVNYFHYVTNGTIALQLALKALDIEEGEIITTPFSYVATISSILWERCKPVFVDIEPHNFTLDPQKIEEALTPRTRAIMPVHVFGYACDVEAIEKIAKKHHLKVIYDAAHAFGSFYKGRALSSYGDISTLSFHATKLFHTVEGGAIIVQDEYVSQKLDLIKRFGHREDKHFYLGINGKQSEFHAAMGLAIFPHLTEIMQLRKHVSDLYDLYLERHLERPKSQKYLEYNYAYYPVLFHNETELKRVFEALNAQNIYPRRYFYPSLTTLPYLKNKQSCPISENICSRIACLPLYPDLKDDEVKKICRIILPSLGNRNLAA